MSITFESRRELASTAVWRGKQTAKYPHDIRNALANQLLSRLALADDSAVTQATLNSLQPYEHTGLLHEALRYETRRVGFATSPATLNEFLADVLRYIRAVEAPTAGASLAGVLPSAQVAQ